MKLTPSCHTNFVRIWKVVPGSSLCLFYDVIRILSVMTQKITQRFSRLRQSRLERRICRSATRMPLLGLIASTRGTPTEMNLPLHFSCWLAISHVESKFTVWFGDTESAKKKTEADFSIMCLFYLFYAKLTGKEILQKIKIVRFQSIGL